MTKPRYPIRLAGTVPDANGDFRSVHSARRGAEEAERFSLDDYRRRNGADPFAASLHGTGREGNYDPHAAKGVEAHFGAPSVEDTRTWGNQTLLTLNAIVPIGPPIAQAFTSTQLVHVSRRRPTSFNILTLVRLIAGWTGESAWDLNIVYTVGVGQAQTQFVITIPIPTPSDGLQVGPHVDQFPLNALQVGCVFSVAAPSDAGFKSVSITQLAAPVFE